MWRTEPINMDQNRNKPIPDERSPLSKPQIFVQLAFGVSWSQRHAPQTHSLTYMSRNLKNARDSGNFPRQVPAPNTNFLDAPEQQPQRQHRTREHASRNHQHRQQSRSHHQSPSSNTLAPPREHRHSKNHTNDQPGEQPRVRPRRESRATLHERGRSAPPPFNDSPWDVRASGSTFAPYRGSGESSQAGKALPAPPSQFRLGEDGLPWSAWAWPGDAPEGDEEDDDTPFANNPTTVPLSTDRLRDDDPERVRELESLSTAMMTVDNGFESQWWYQGSRESVEPWWSQEVEDEETDDARTLTTAEALPLTAQAIPLPNSDPPSAIEYSSEPIASFHDMVSPISDTSSPTQSFRGPLYRSLTTRSEELWLGR